jgi:drug/metabolite transporter (DMT)-like permease
MMSLRNGVIVYVEALGAVIIWGGTFIATKVALRDVSPATIVWMRFGLGVIVLGAAVLLRKQFVLPAKSELGYFAMLGFLGVTFHQWLQANGLVTAQASTTAWIVATTPVFMALLGWLILKENLGWLRSGGILLAALGVLLIVSGGDILALFAGKEGTLGDVLVMISAPNWAVFSVLSRRGLQTHPAARMMFFVMTLGWLFTSAWIFGLGPGLREIPKLTPPGWISILLLGVFGSGLAYIAWYDALQALPASQLGAFLYIEPLVTVVIAAIILGESFTFISLLGGGIILFGVYLVNQK